MLLCRVMGIWFWWFCSSSSEWLVLFSCAKLLGALFEIFFFLFCSLFADCVTTRLEWLSFLVFASSFMMSWKPCSIGILPILFVTSADTRWLLWLYFLLKMLLAWEPGSNARKLRLWALTPRRDSLSCDGPVSSSSLLTFSFWSVPSLSSFLVVTSWLQIKSVDFNSFCLYMVYLIFLLFLRESDYLSHYSYYADVWDCRAFDSDAFLLPSFFGVFVLGGLPLFLPQRELFVVYFSILGGSNLLSFWMDYILLWIFELTSLFLPLF